MDGKEERGIVVLASFEWVTSSRVQTLKKNGCQTAWESDQSRETCRNSHCGIGTCGFWGREVLSGMAEEELQGVKTEAAVEMPPNSANMIVSFRAKGQADEPRVKTWR